MSELFGFRDIWNSPVTAKLFFWAWIPLPCFYMGYYSEPPNTKQTPPTEISGVGEDFFEKLCELRSEGWEVLGCLQVWCSVLSVPKGPKCWDQRKLGHCACGQKHGQPSELASDHARRDFVGRGEDRMHNATWIGKLLKTFSRVWVQVIYFWRTNEATFRSFWGGPPASRDTVE